MTRMFLDDWQANCEATIYDNTEKLISGNEVQQILIDLKDSSIQDEAGLTNLAGADITANLTDVWTRIDDAFDSPTLAYDTVVGGDNEFLIVDQVNGVITSSATAGFSYEALGAVTINSSNNEVIEAAIALDGVPGDLIASNVGSSGTRPESLFLRRYLPSVPASSEFSIIVRAPDGNASNVTISTRTFGLIILPTNNP